MARLPKPSAVIFVRDVPMMTEFYRKLAQMTFRSGDDGHSVLEIENFQLVIHALRGAPTSSVVDGVALRRDAYVKVCLPVESIAAARTIATQMGGAIKPPRNEWEAPDRGFRACDGHDPEGNVLQVREQVAGA
jgi:predicted enzyme related to lactoylglutathione lyase